MPTPVHVACEPRDVYGDERTSSLVESSPLLALLFLAVSVLRGKSFHLFIRLLFSSLQNSSILAFVKLQGQGLCLPADILVVDVQPMVLGFGEHYNPAGTKRSKHHHA